MKVICLSKGASYTKAATAHQMNKVLCVLFLYNSHEIAKIKEKTTNGNRKNKYSKLVRRMEGNMRNRRNQQQ